MRTRKPTTHKNKIEIQKIAWRYPNAQALRQQKLPRVLSPQSSTLRACATGRGNPRAGSEGE
jgi:hypothetical protein